MRRNRSMTRCKFLWCQPLTCQILRNHTMWRGNARRGMGDCRPPYSGRAAYASVHRRPSTPTVCGAHHNPVRGVLPSRAPRAHREMVVAQRVGHTLLVAASSLGLTASPHQAATHPDFPHTTRLLPNGPPGEGAQSPTRIDTRTRAYVAAGR